MGLFGINLKKIVSGAAKKVLPKIMVGGDQGDRKATQAFINTGAADPIFDKFGAQVETIAKVGVGIAGAAVGGSLLGKIGSPTPATGGNAGIGALLKSSTSKPVGLIDTITKGINKVDAFSKTTLGSQLIGTMGKLVSNLGTPQGAKPSNVPQQLALNQGTAQSVPETIAQSAVFQGKGIEIKTGGSNANGDTWWNRNKSWIIPALIAVPGFFITLFLLFGKRRR
jgi:hypothetical protein